jgi:deoxycytidine triphosphate deaminase
MEVMLAQTIRSEIVAGRLLRNSNPGSVQAASYDLRIGTIFKEGQIINGLQQGGVTSVVLKPGGVLSMFTLEEVVLTADVLATVFPINSQSSRGLLVLNPGHVDPGYDGPITVKVLNISKSDMIIKLGQPIFTAIFERMTMSTTEPYPASTKSRATREIEFAERDINVSPGSLVKLVGEPNMLVIEKMIQSHWTSRVSVFLALGAFVFAVIAAMPVFREAADKIRPSTSGQKASDDDLAPVGKSSAKQGVAIKPKAPASGGKN